MQHVQPDLEHNRPMPAGLALFVMVFALLMGLFLNSADIKRTAERQEQGWQRTVGLALIGSVHDVSSFLRLDRPRQMLDVALGRETAAPPPEVDTAAPPVTSTTVPVATSTTQIGRRTVTADDPLVVYIGGDSLVGQFGPMLQNELNKTGLVDSEVVYEFESGLSRPDFVDWPARIDEVRQRLDPDVLVLYFGGNDAQGISMPDGSWIDFGTPEWETEYARRVGGVMTTLDDDGRWVYWMGMPIVQSDTFAPRVELMNSIYERMAAEHERVTFVPAWDLFTGPDGGYSEFLENSDGQLVDMRLDDGVHYTTAGGVRLAEHTAAIIAEDWSLPYGD